EAGHPDVEEGQVEGVRRRPGQRRLAVLDDRHRVAGLAEEPLEEPAYRGLVVGDEDARGHSGPPAPPGPLRPTGGRVHDTRPPGPPGPSGGRGRAAMRRGGALSAGPP